jgi:predicted RNA binding protein YcfA (HicA-like mRNA interferase family)
MDDRRLRIVVPVHPGREEFDKFLKEIWEPLCFTVFI